MHAGDALWKLYGLAGLLNSGRDCEMLATMTRDCCTAIGELIGVPAPSPEQLANIMTMLASPTVPQPEEPEKPRRSANNASALVEAVALLTSRMIDDEAFEWVTSGILESIHEQTDREQDPFVTPKQCLAVLNIAERGEVFITDFESDHPEELRLVTEHARK